MTGFGGTLLLVTAAVTVTSSILGAGNVFECDDPNDCTGAAIDDIADFDLTDIIDVLQFLFIFVGDLLELGSFAWLPGMDPTIQVFLQFFLVFGWVIGIVSLFV